MPGTIFCLFVQPDSAVWRTLISLRTMIRIGSGKQSSHTSNMILLKVVCSWCNMPHEFLADYPVAVPCSSSESKRSTIHNFNEFNRSRRIHDSKPLTFFLHYSYRSSFPYPLAKTDSGGFAAFEYRCPYISIAFHGRPLSRLPCGKFAGPVPHHPARRDPANFLISSHLRVSLRTGRNLAPSRSGENPLGGKTP